MIRVWTDFNALSTLDRAWLLKSGNAPFDPAFLGLSHGDRILLWQDEDDFEVEGVLAFGRPGPPAVDRDAWYAQVDWPTLRRLSEVAPA
ncbi:hypothetical protein [Brevundimonas sp.]|jgi:hypothetical protein|uniref:hypothetical protein n=1 Tax=Brevundimonas sp. TaxID=1871086 RepID=UPI002E138ED4|nr:hypothetical protein [Brevundimonas sp.]